MFEDKISWISYFFNFIIHGTVEKLRRNSYSSVLGHLSRSGYFKIDLDDFTRYVGFQETWWKNFREHVRKICNLWFDAPLSSLFNGENRRTLSSSHRKLFAMNNCQVTFGPPCIWNRRIYFLNTVKKGVNLSVNMEWLI